MWKFLQPAPHKPELPAEKVDREYIRLRRQVFWGIFIGYAGYYLVRKNFSIAMPALESLGYDKADLGWALSAVSIAYGISKFVMGTVSDRSNARVFIPLGLIASAIVMILMGILPWGSISIPVAIMAMFCLLFVNGWMQGMGWPPCGRVMTHWFCTKERGVKMSMWNVAHNIGGAAMAPLAAFGITLGYTLFGDPLGGAFYVPAVVALAIAAGGLPHGARHAPVVRPAARRDLETRNQTILRLEREGDDRAADSIRQRTEQQTSVADRLRQRLHLFRPLRRARLGALLPDDSGS